MHVRHVPRNAINWHAGRRNDELTLRYRRLRCSIWEDTDVFIDPVEAFHAEEIIDDDFDEDQEAILVKKWAYAHCRAICELQVNRQLYCVRNSMGSLLPEDHWNELVRKAPPDGDHQNIQNYSRPSSSDEPLPTAALDVAQLAAHVKDITTHWAQGQTDWLEAQPVGNHLTPRELYHCWAHRDERALLPLCLIFERYWVRRLSQPPPAGELLSHLFAKHPVPKCLINRLRRNPHELMWLYWIIVMGQGSSLHHAANYFGWPVPRGLTRHLYEAPNYYSAAMGYLWADMRRLGGTPDEARVLAECYAVILERPSRQHPFEKSLAFCQLAMHWIINQRDALAACVEREIAQHPEVHVINHSSDELTRSYCRRELLESVLLWCSDQYESMHELTDMWLCGARRMARNAVVFDCDKATPFLFGHWKERGLNWEYRDAEGSVWSIQEITSSLALYEEGQAMHHCIFDCRAHCMEGQSTVWSWRHNGRRILTMMIDQHGTTLKGHCNRNPHPLELAVVRKWQEAHLGNIPNRHINAAA